MTRRQAQGALVVRNVPRYCSQTGGNFHYIFFPGDFDVRMGWLAAMVRPKPLLECY